MTNFGVDRDNDLTIIKSTDCVTPDTILCESKSTQHVSTHANPLVPPMFLPPSTLEQMQRWRQMTATTPSKPPSAPKREHLPPSGKLLVTILWTKSPSIPTAAQKLLTNGGWQTFSRQSKRQPNVQQRGKSLSSKPRHSAHVQFPWLPQNSG